MDVCQVIKTPVWQKKHRITPAQPLCQIHANIQFFFVVAHGFLLKLGMFLSTNKETFLIQLPFCIFNSCSAYKHSQTHINRRGT